MRRYLKTGNAGYQFGKALTDYGVTVGPMRHHSDADPFPAIESARSQAIEETREAAAKICDDSANYWRNADPKKEAWTPEQMTLRLTEAVYLAAQVRKLELSPPPAVSGRTE